MKVIDELELVLSANVLQEESPQQTDPKHKRHDTAYSGRFLTSGREFRPTDSQPSITAVDNAMQVCRDIMNQYT